MKFLYKIKKTLRSISKHNGIFYITEDKSKIVGFVVGLIWKPSKVEAMETKNKTLTGEVAELYIDPFYRGSGLGRKLMAETEGYFRANKCTDVSLWVFQPNINAHGFYRRIGYVDRTIRMLKEL